MWCVIEDHSEQGGGVTVWGPFYQANRARKVEEARVKVADEAWGGEGQALNYGIQIDVRKMEAHS